MLKVAAAMLVLGWTAIGQAELYQVTASGLYQSKVQNTVPTWVKIHSFSSSDTVYCGDSSPPPGGDDDDDDDDDDTDDTTVSKIAAITLTTVRDAREASTLITVADLFLRDGVNMAKAKEGMSAAISVLHASPLFSGNKFDQWLAQVNTLSPGPYTKDFLASMKAGLSKAYPTADKLQSGGEEINLGEILKLIMTIIQLLKDLGILDFAGDGLGWMPMNGELRTPAEQRALMQLVAQGKGLVGSR